MSIFLETRGRELVLLDRYLLNRLFPLVADYDLLVVKIHLFSFKNYGFPLFPLFPGPVIL